MALSYETKEAIKAEVNNQIKKNGYVDYVETGKKLNISTECVRYNVAIYGMVPIEKR